MAYPQDAGLSSLMANYGNISQGMNPGQQPSFGGNSYFPGMPAQQVPSYQPQDWGGFAPGQLSSQYGQSTYGTNNGMVNYGYGQQPVIDYAKQLADQQAKAAADQAATTQSPAAQNVYAAPPMNGGQGGNSRPVDSNPAWTNSTDGEKAAWYAEHPNFSTLTQGLQNAWGYTSLGALQNKFDPGFTDRQEAIAKGFDPTPVGGPLDSVYRNSNFNEAPSNNNNEAQSNNNTSNAVGGYYAHGQFNQPANYAYGGITSLLR